MRYVLAALILFASLPAYAQDSDDNDDSQSHCAPYAALAKVLDEKYHEHAIGEGLVGKSHIIQLFATDDGTTWTMVSLAAKRAENGGIVACVIIDGTDWQKAAEKKPPPA